MISGIKRIIKRASFLFYIPDILFLPFYGVSVIWFRIVKFVGFRKAPLTRWIFHKAGVFPLVDHYYEPFFQFSRLSKSYSQERYLTAIEWNAAEQLEILSAFAFQPELDEYPIKKSNDWKENVHFYHDNGSFSYADAEYLYSFIRWVKPCKIVEIGSGFSTLVMRDSIRKNQELDNIECDLVCIEPYEMPWLESAGVTVFRKRVESIDIQYFKELKAGDILFIDSSHMIRPEGDVLFEIFSILPTISPGVFVHFHDIFTPFHYPKKWLTHDYRFWNEQYLLESFLMYNSCFKIVGALRYLQHHHTDLINKKFPAASKVKAEGSSFWIKKTV